MLNYILMSFTSSRLKTEKRQYVSSDSTTWFNTCWEIEISHWLITYESMWHSDRERSHYCTRKKWKRMMNNVIRHICCANCLLIIIIWKLSNYILMNFTSSRSKTERRQCVSSDSTAWFNARWEIEISHWLIIYESM